MALPPQQFCVRWNSYHTNLQAVFPRLLLTEQFADVTLACESRQLRCHKLVLSACSAYLERLLLQNPCKHPIVLMRDMRFSEMQALVDFMYKGEVNVTQEELPSLLKSAEALQIRGLCSGEAGAGGAGAASGSEGQETSSRDFTLASDALLHAHRNNGLCSGEAGAGGAGAASGSEGQETSSRDFTLASDALLHAHRNNAHQQQQPPLQQTPSKPLYNSSSSNGPKKRKSEEREREKTEVKEETVEEDGLYYGELDNDHLDYNEDEETGKPGSSLAQSSGRRRAPLRPNLPTNLPTGLPTGLPTSLPTYLRVKPESELFFQTKLQNLEYMNRLSKMNATEIQNEFSKYGLTNMAEDAQKNSENDYYKSWLEQNGELEVSLLKAGQPKRPRGDLRADLRQRRSEVELIPRGKDAPGDRAARKRGRPPVFRDKNVDIGETVLKADLDQFLEGKEVSSSGLSRKDLERVMMGKFNPNRRYSNEAMWAALMDVKKGGSIYRAAQTHKVPRKSLRNWMKRCHIKSSFPMPQQLKQFVENSKKQREDRAGPDDADAPPDDADAPPDDADAPPDDADAPPYAADVDFGKHFLTFAGARASSDDDAAPDDRPPRAAQPGRGAADAALDMSLRE